MKKIITGRVWLLADDVNTDILAPGFAMKLPIDQIAKYCLINTFPLFPTEVKQGDIIVAGTNFGTGSSREQAAIVLKHLGIRAIVARSYSRIFYRNAFNIGLALFNVDTKLNIDNGNEIELDIIDHKLKDKINSKTYNLAEIPKHLMKLLQAGGLMGLLKEENYK